MGTAGKSEGDSEQRERVREHVRTVLAKISELKNSRTTPKVAA
jgi:hypothetical protein